VSRPHVAVVFGTRPEVIKLGPVIEELRRIPGEFRVTTIASGQHREMLEQALAFFGLVPDVSLRIMQDNQQLGTVTVRALDRMGRALDELRPDALLVQGDTTTAFGAALAAYYRRVPVGHVEAGLRSRDRFNPYPEEANRQMIGALAEWHFAPTARARSNLLNEGVATDRVFVTGNTVIDTLARVMAREGSALPAEVAGVDLAGARRLVLVTCHRRESFGPGFSSILAAVRAVVEKNPDVMVVYPVHPNPNVHRVAHEILGAVPRVHLVPPVDYRAFLALMKRAHVILTDSGGVQEEAPFLRKPVLVLRTTTERPEGLDAGVARLVGTDPGVIAGETQRLLDDPEAYRTMAHGASPYGDGHAAERIVQILRARVQAG
jgi:UDP-N-acetylglucosamine 2-epimerase (non-hydrolysing)